METSRLRVYITVDTETSMGGAWSNPTWSPLPLSGPVFGHCGTISYGIPLIMDILEEHGFRATFFTEVFCAPIVGYADVEKALRLIAERGHDVQLHLHPIYWFYREALMGRMRREIDLMFQLSESEQHELIGEGIALFRKLSGISPRAYRAGCYGASETTLRVLKSHGIEIDCSYNLAYRSVTCGFRTPFLNAPAMIEGICELPVSVFRIAGWSGYKPLEISAVSVGEIIAAIQSFRDAGCSDVVLMLHSFSLMKNTGVRYECCRPNRIVIHRFRRLCAALELLKEEVVVTTLRDIDLAALPLVQPQTAPAVAPFRPAVRKLVQALNGLPWL